MMPYPNFSGSCGAPVVMNAVTCQKRPTYVVGDNVKCNCSSGEAMHIHCQVNGTWGPPLTIFCNCEFRHNES